jgi:hypothetical protein
MRSSRNQFGVILTLLAVLAQLHWNTSVPDLLGLELAALLNDPGAICHSGLGDDNGSHAPAAPMQDCPCCLCCATPVLPPPLLVVGFLLPLPAPVSRLSFAPVPPATGPPARHVTDPFPRGPPLQA